MYCWSSLSDGQQGTVLLINTIRVVTLMLLEMCIMMGGVSKRLPQLSNASMALCPVHIMCHADPVVRTQHIILRVPWSSATAWSFTARDIDVRTIFVP